MDAGAAKRPQTFKKGNPYAIKKGENRAQGRQGRPLGFTPLTVVLKRIANNEIDIFDPIAQKQTKKTVGEIIILQLLAKGMKGDIRAIETILNRTDGMPKQEIEASINRGSEKFDHMSDEEVIQRIKQLTPKVNKNG